MTYVETIAIPAFAVVNAPLDDERDFIRRAQAGDAAAFERLYRTHLPRVHAVIFRLTADATRAEELTQKSFLTVWEKLPLFRGESAFSTWLHRLAVNTVLADLRAEQRRTARIFGTADPSLLETPATPPPPGIRLDLEQAIAALPAQARTVFVLHDVEGWPHGEIAEKLGVAIGTTKAQLHRARKLLQEFLR